MCGDDLGRTHGHRAGCAQGTRGTGLASGVLSLRQYVASASLDGTVRLWRASDGSPVTTLSGHNGSKVLYVAFSPDGETLWSGDIDGTVMMHRMSEIIPIDGREP